MESILVIDTETGGLDPTHFSILSLGAVVLDGSRVSAEFEVYIQEPQICADKEALEVNRITVDWLDSNGVSPSEAVRRLLEFMDTHLPDKTDDKSLIVAGHNTWFDIAFLRRLFQLAEVPFPRRISHRFIDTSCLIQLLRVFGLLNVNTGSADEVFEYFEISVDPQQRHTALGDARATAILLCTLKDFIHHRM